MAKFDERFDQMSPLQKAVFALKETRARLDELQERRTEPIAIVGMACRFPGGSVDPEAYWRTLCDGTDAVTEVPPERWDVDGYYDPDARAPGKMNTRWGGFLQNVDHFDNHFFGISDREAVRIDPQQRLLLELAWEALENAGIPAAGLRGSDTAVFIGISNSDYGLRMTSVADAYIGAGTALSIAANRISFTFDFHGPSVALDTACSSSMVAVHLAVQSIRNGESRVALAGGVNIVLSPIASINLTKAGLTSPDGRVRAFDAEAAGYVRSEGGGLVALKRLSDALADNDPIWAVIRATAVNQAGATSGPLTPNGKAQEMVVRNACQAAGVSPGDIQYVEAHGTGTPLGDAIEVVALGNVLGKDRPAGKPCRLGAVKTNLGHLEAAAGIAALVKTALAIKHRRLPANLHYNTPNPNIPFARLPIQVQQRLEPWPDESAPLLAGVSAFGFGGSNTHAVLGAAPEPDSAGKERQEAPVVGPVVLPISARTETALKMLAESYCRYLADDPPPLADICYTASARRDHHDCRLAVVSSSHDEAIELFSRFVAGDSVPGIASGRKPFGRRTKAAFVFGADTTGWLEAARLLRDREHEFRSALEQYDRMLEQAAGWSVGQLLDLDGQSDFDDPAQARPAVLVLQLALVELWKSWGITPDFTAGHGVGELAAACAAESIAAEDALKVAVNSNGAAVKAKVARVPFASAADGKVHNGRDLTADRWARCLEQESDVLSAVTSLADREVDVFIEIGPAAATDAIQKHLEAEKAEGCAVASLASDGSESAGLSHALGALYAAGFSVRWDRPGLSGRCVAVPSYPWQRQRLWIDEECMVIGDKVSSSEQSRIPPPPKMAGRSNAEAATAGSLLAELELLSDPLGESAEPRVRPELNTPFVPAKTDLEKEICQAWVDVLKLDRVGIYDDFFELGGDSLHAAMLLNKLQTQLTDEVDAMALFQAQNVHDLSAYLDENYADAIRATAARRASQATGESQSPDTAGSAAGGNRAKTPAAEKSTIRRMSTEGGADELLANIDDLSDEEVQTLLDENIERDGATNE